MADRPEHGVSRRGLLAAGVAAPMLAGTGPAAASPWKDAVIVNALGGLDNPNAAAESAGSPVSRGVRKPMVLDARTLADARASGVTAINCTLGYVAGPLLAIGHHRLQVAGQHRAGSRRRLAALPGRGPRGLRRQGRLLKRTISSTTSGPRASASRTIDSNVSPETCRSITWSSP